MAKETATDARRLLPSVEQVLQHPVLQSLVGTHGRPIVLRHLRAALEDLRRRAAEGVSGLEEAVVALPADVAARVEAATRPSLRRGTNAPGGRLPPHPGP